MSVGPEQRLNPEERSNLVAYIDGELTDDEARAIATKLTQSPTARREVDSLRKTWELLEYLPRPQASQEFPDRTLSSIRTFQSRGGTWNRITQNGLVIGAKIGILVVVAAVSLGVGFFMTWWVWPDPAARLARDLSLAVHLEEYQEVGTFEFLDELTRSKEFGSPSL
jgi:ferric-dicitrate binding protein FerR (iron transport regulator)